MFDFNQRITNIDQAKEFYWHMGCNRFHMSREYPERDNEFRALNISDDTINCWHNERIELLYNTIVKENTNDLCNHLYSYLNLIDGYLTPKIIKQTYKLIKAKYKYCSPRYIILICEIISNTTSTYPKHCVLASKSIGNIWFLKYYFLVKKMVKYACKKDPSLVSRSKQILDFKKLEKELHDLYDSLKPYID